MLTTKSLNYCTPVESYYYMTPLQNLLVFPLKVSVQMQTIPLPLDLVIYLLFKSLLSTKYRRWDFNPVFSPLSAIFLLLYYYKNPYQIWRNKSSFDRLLNIKALRE